MSSSDDVSRAVGPGARRCGVVLQRASSDRGPHREQRGRGGHTTAGGYGTGVRALSDLPGGGICDIIHIIGRNGAVSQPVFASLLPFQRLPGYAPPCRELRQRQSGSPDHGPPTAGSPPWPRATSLMYARSPKGRQEAAVGGSRGRRRGRAGFPVGAGRTVDHHVGRTGWGRYAGRACRQRAAGAMTLATEAGFGPLSVRNTGVGVESRSPAGSAWCSYRGQRYLPIARRACVRGPCLGDEVVRLPSGMRPAPWRA